MEELNLKQKIELKRIKDYDIARIDVEYSGGGDDGMIDNIDYFDINDEVINFDIKECLIEYFYSYICKNIEWDWINNDGGYGTLIIDISKNEIDINHYQRHTESYEYSPDCNKIFKVLNGAS